MVPDSLLVGLRGGFCRVVAAATALALATAGCSYRSTYVAPPDGRARVVWGPNDNPSVEMSGASISSDCGAQLRDSTQHARLPLARGYRELSPGPTELAVSSGYWAPRYYGPPIVVVQPGFAPPFLRPPLFVPRLGPPLPTPVHVVSGSIVARGGGGSGGHGGGGGSINLGSGNGVGELVLILAVITAAVLPAVALGLAASMPESSERSANAIDLVNAYNDLARVDGTACTPAPPPDLQPGGFSLPQEPLR